MSELTLLVAELQNGSTDLASCLSSRPELSRDEQFQLLLADQKYRARRHEPFSVDHYCDILPWLATDPSRRMEVIANEFALRLGSESPDALFAQFEVHLQSFGEPLTALLREQVRQWQAQPLDARAFDRLCDAFEEEVGAGKLASIESYLQRAPTASHPQLLQELILIETYHLARSGNPIDWDDYLRRFPSDHESIRSLQGRHANQAPILPSRSLSTQSDLLEKKLDDLAGSFISNKTVGDLRNGRYQFIRKLGQGAYGSVYLAQDIDLKRRVAVKIPSREALEKLVDVDSYLVEAQTVAALDHPHIVTVHDVGRTLDGSVYLVSKFIDGCSLDDWIKRNDRDFQKITKLLEPIAEALHHAHQRRLIHRDIKPANILIEEATGTPYVADFGLAIREEDYLLDRRVAGTPSYMSPEQVRGEGHRLDGRSDLFSLGVVMYLMLTGRLPFPGQTREEISNEIITIEPIAPRSIRHDIPAELDRICLKLLRKRASERYANGLELAEDLRAWLTPGAIPIATVAPQKITPRGLRSFTAEDAGFFLDLLPGPRNRDGLPESIVFWKERIEQRDPDQTFSVGLLYGPSGCGKSSLVKAGLIPNLSSEVIAIYLEAIPEETETRLLRQLHKRMADLPADLGLVETAERIRRSNGPKVVLILDQFEQWLYSHRVDQEGALIRTLRQCDGGRLQVVLMIRDDFYLAAARLMNQIDVPILTDRNFKLVDLFDTQHARRVLTRFGQSYDRLPMDSTSLSADQTAFIDQVVDGLSENGTVVSVRLSLLAYMLRGRDWVPTTLEAIGGLDGIGISFLDETFSSHRADARHRTHQVAVRGVLRALLPELGTDIKGAIRSEEQLLEASGYSHRPQDFEDLMRILDGELRMLTPTDPEEMEKGEKRGEKPWNDSVSNPSISSPPTCHFYQLTHDYLVPSLKEWLTSKQRETHKGRAELKLAERATAWRFIRENKQLPTLVEWFQIRRWTEPDRWKDNEAEMMRQATRHHGRRVALVTAAALFFALGVWSAWQESTKTLIKARVGTLTTAEPAQIPSIVRQLDKNPDVAARYLAPLLSAEVTTPDEKRFRLHAQMASVSRDPSLIEPLVEEFLTGHANYILPIRELLRPSASKWIDFFRSILNDPKADRQRRFRAALALADYQPASDEELWTEANRLFVAQQLVSENADHQRLLREALRPIQEKLTMDLERIFDDATANDSQRLSAANALADYCRDDSARLTTLTTLATPEQFEVLYPLVSTVVSPETVAQLSNVATLSSPTDLGMAQRVEYGRRRANAAVTLLRLGKPEKALPVFDWTDDPEAMTQFIFRCKPRGIRIDTLLDLLDITTRSVSEEWDRARYALLLAIGEYAPSDIPPARRDALVEQLADWYANNPNSGVHGAAGWLLRFLGESRVVDRVDQTPVPYSPDREWYTLAITVQPNPMEGQEPPAPKTFYYTFVVFPGQEYILGSKEDELERRNERESHRMTLTRTFAILDREITFEELIAFSPPYQSFMVQYKATTDHAGFGPHWYDAVTYCRWLSKEMGYPESDQCYPNPDSLDAGTYPRESNKEVNNAPKDWPIDLDRLGFRLPTEAEWEVAARSGTPMAFGFGSDFALLDKFGWSARNSKQSHPTKRLRPSLRGLFDIAGNLFEWNHDYFLPEQPATTIDPVISSGGEIRVVRGGAWDFDPAGCRAASRNGRSPVSRSYSTGFRIVQLPSITKNP